MKTYKALLSLGVLALLVACAPVEPAGPVDDDSGEQVVVTGDSGDGDQLEVEEPGPGISLPLDGVGSGDGADGPAPTASWNTEPDSLIIRGTFCCGFVPQLVPVNYIPDFSVWGDGRIVWTSYNDEAPRRSVWEARLDEATMQQLITQITGSGFFSWDSRYANNSVADFADKCMAVNLLEQSHKVCEYFEGAPEEFHRLYEMLNSGMGSRGVDFVPAAGLLIARPFAGSDVETFVWEPSRSGLSLDSAIEPGLWVEAEALSAAWAAVNANPWAPFVKDNGADYQVTVQVPGLSMSEPPAP